MDDLATRGRHGSMSGVTITSTDFEGGIAYESTYMTEKNLRQKLLENVQIMTTDKGHSETQWGDDSPTGQPVIYINDSKYKGAARDKMISAESLHLLKFVDPERHADLESTALADPEYMKWANSSYDIVTGKKPDPETGEFIPEGERETRDFGKWHNISRFDQVIGGYLYAQDKDLPTMKNWNRAELQMGTDLRGKLQTFAEEWETPPKLGKPNGGRPL
jgi:hypothetical protein